MENQNSDNDKEINKLFEDTFPAIPFSEFQANNLFDFTQTWVTCNKTVNLLSIENLKDFRKEQRLEFFQQSRWLLEHKHPNILHFFGITTEPDTGKYLVVSDNYAWKLEKYLFQSLREQYLIFFAREIIKGLSWLHENNMVHGNLNSSNIVIGNDNAVRISFPSLYQESIDHPMNTSNVYDLLPFVEPQYVKNPNYLRDSRSDIYSLGVILWQLSNGNSISAKYSPNELVDRILLGMRESPAKNIHSEYNKLYMRCWQYDPEKRPMIQEVSRLIELIKFDEEKSELETDGFNDSTNEKDQSSTEISSEAINILDQILDIYDKGTRRTGRDEMVIKSINQFLVDKDKTFKDIFQLLQPVRYKPQYASLLGFLYHLGSGVAEDKIAACNWYTVAIQGNNDAFSYNQLGYLCRQEDKARAFYEKSIEFGHPQGKSNLARILRTRPTGSQDLQRSFELYSSAAAGGYIGGYYGLGTLYKNGFGVEKDTQKAFSYFLQAATGGYYRAQYLVGRYYYAGIGTSVDQSMAFYWMREASQQGHHKAQLLVGYWYETGRGIDQNYRNAFVWYAQFENHEAYSKLGNSYFIGKGTNKDLHEAIKYYRKNLTHSIYSLDFVFRSRTRLNPSH